MFNYLKPLVLLSACVLHASPSVAETFQAKDIFDLEYASSPTISPNGEHIVFVRNSNNVMRDATDKSLWLINTKSGALTPLFSDNSQYSSPVWSPSGDRIAFISNLSGKSQIHVHYLKQNRTAMVSQLQSSISNLTWSPDGNWLAFSKKVHEKPSVIAKMPKVPKGANWAKPAIVIDTAYYQADGKGLIKPGYNQLFILPSEGGTAQQITSGNYHHKGKLTWTKDSKTIVFSANRLTDWEYKTLEGDLFKIDIATKRLTQLTQSPGREFSPQFSENGEKLVYLHSSNELNPYRNNKLHIMEWRSKQTKAIKPDFDRSVVSPMWIGKNTLAISYDDFGKRKIASISTSGKLKDLTDSVSGTTLGRPYISGEFSANYRGDIVFTYGDANQPADVATVSLKGKTRQFTSLNHDLLNHRTLGKVHEINYTSSFDGEAIQGWYITPPNFDPKKKYPLILEIHGGPHLAYGPHFSAELQRYAAQGYVVFYDNHRGSSSYGERFAMLLKYKYSSKEDFADHNSGVDAMIAKGFIDKDQLFIAGGSAGGIATAYAIGLTDRFAAAVVVKPVINWLSKVLTADSGLRQIPTQFPGMPWEHVEHYWQRSPLSLVGNVTTPTMLITGEKDLRTPMAETEQYYQALKLRKIDSVLLKIPDAYHGIAGKPSRMISKIEHTLAWFDKYNN